jgi:clan AA aspartic protease
VETIELAEQAFLHSQRYSFQSEKNIHDSLKRITRRYPLIAVSLIQLVFIKEKNMGEVRTEITLVNIKDAVKAESGLIPEAEVRQLTVDAVVDTGAWTLVINEKTREKLGLRVKKPVETGVAGGGTVPGGITEYVEVRWKDRNTACEALVLPDEEDILLGAYLLEGMDLTVNPKKQEVVGAHGDKVRYVVK